MQTITLDPVALATAIGLVITALAGLVTAIGVLIRTMRMSEQLDDNTATTNETAAKVDDIHAAVTKVDAPSV